MFPPKILPLNYTKTEEKLWLNFLPKAFKVMQNQNMLKKSCNQSRGTKSFFRTFIIYILWLVSPTWQDCQQSILCGGFEKISKEILPQKARSF